MLVRGGGTSRGRGGVLPVAITVSHGSGGLGGMGELRPTVESEPGCEKQILATSLHWDHQAMIVREHANTGGAGEGDPTPSRWEPVHHTGGQSGLLVCVFFQLRD